MDEMITNYFIIESKLIRGDKIKMQIDALIHVAQIQRRLLRCIGMKDANNFYILFAMLSCILIVARIISLVNRQFSLGIIHRNNCVFTY